MEGKKIYNMKIFKTCPKTVFKSIEGDRKEKQESLKEKNLHKGSN